MIAPATRSMEQRVKAQAYALGFDLAGITTLGPAGTDDAFRRWLARGFAGEMHYLGRGAHKRSDTRLPFPGARSAVVVGLNYGGTQPTGTVARYARGDDYHDVMLARLRDLHSWISREMGHGRKIAGKAYVDTGPILERDLARKAGLGWFGKNTMLINPGMGSFFFIGALLLDLELEPDPPFDTDHCGTCTRCLDACPTRALVEPGLLDATLCISYLTIELRGAIPEPLREKIGSLLYGCDICQDVCPWNVRFSRDVTEPALAPRAVMMDLEPRELLLMDDEGYRARFRGSAMKRARRSGLARNAAVAVGNRRDSGDREALERALGDPDTMVQEHVKWALRELGKGGQDDHARWTSQRETT